MASFFVSDTTQAMFIIRQQTNRMPPSPVLMGRVENNIGSHCG